MFCNVLIRYKISFFEVALILTNVCRRFALFLVFSAFSLSSLSSMCLCFVCEFLF